MVRRARGYTVDGFTVVAAGPDRVVLERDGVRTAYDVAVTGDAVDVDAATGHVRLTVVPRFTDPADAVASGSLLAPMPGTVVRVAVAEGDVVEAGQTVLVLEAMKMQHTVTAPHAGTVTRMSVQSGAQVAADEVLAVVETVVGRAEPRPRERRNRDDRVHREPGAPGAAPRGGQAGRHVRPRVVHREGARRGRRPPTCGWRSARTATSASTSRRSTAGAAAASATSPRCARSSPRKGCPLLLMVVSPAICGTIISRYGTEEQKRRWLPGICDGTGTMAFAITEPDAGTNTHNITTTARRDGDGWVLNGRKIYISGVDEADNVLVVARTEDARTGKLKPVLFVVPTDAEGFEARPIPMEIVSPELQFQVFIDDVRLPDDAVVGDEDGGLVQLFAGLNPERIMAASFSTGLARFALEKAAAYAKERTVFQGPIGSHQAIAHPLAQSKIEIELARLMTQKAAALYDAGDDMGAGEAANMAKYAAAEAACDAADRAVQTHGGNGITQEYGMAGLLVATRAGRIAPVSREMILNFVAMHSLGLPKSY